MSFHVRKVRDADWLVKRFRNTVANTFAWSSCMSARDSKLEAQSLDLLVNEPAFAFSPLSAGDEERILEADEIAAELVDSFEVRFLPPTPAQRRASAAHRGAAVTPPLAATPLSRAHSEITVNGTAHAREPAAGSDAELVAAREQLARLQTQMRARDAYLKELERALDASTRQLEASGLGSVEDAQRLLGRLRGQAFRIAELESELRQARESLAGSRRPARGKTRAHKR